MRYAFWVSGALLLYTFLGYPFWLYLSSRLRPHPVHRESIQPEVSILMAVHNEAAALPAKLRNLQELDYPAGRLELVVVSDGSSDATNEILRAWHGERRLAIIVPVNEGKAEALNRAVAAAQGDIVVFTDARQSIDSDAVRFLVENFADSGVGCASGELLLDCAGEAMMAGLGFYWQYEKKIRQWESASGSVVGVTGALYAARKKAVPTLPAGAILDDVFIPLLVAGRGQRVIFDGRAVSRDQLGGSRHEFWRKVRTLAGNYQLLQLAPWLLTASNPIRFRLISHKLLRLVVPFALLGILVSSIVLTSALYRVALAGEMALGLCALLTAFRARLGLISRLAQVCSTFLVLNAAAIVAFAYIATGRRVAWTR
ncbi:MAG TPA: glycosyltransferase family 2 protein [Terriglobia bacterium]|nr:glycosyltransferase family 2 protein [Terriglobia bacterium]